MLPVTIEWISRDPGCLVPGYVRMIDQVRLPQTLAYLETDDLETIREAIITLQVRGAPAIGVAAAMGLVCAAQAAPAETDARLAAVRSAAERLRSSRPTAVNLFWAIERMTRRAETLGRLPTTRGVFIHRSRPWLIGLAAGCLSIALARPQSGVEATRLRTDALDMVLAIDISSSMLAEDFELDGRTVNRLEAVIDVARRFIERHPDDRIGLVAYAGVPYTIAPPTLDHAWLLERLEEVGIGMVRDGTAIGDGLAASLNRLRDSEADSRIVILLTDGVHNAGTLQPDAAAEIARTLGIRVYTVGVGTRGMAPMPVRDPFGRTRRVMQPVEIDEALMTRMAERTGAVYARAVDTESLEDVYRRIDELERTEIEGDRYRRYNERFFPWALAGILLLALEQAVALSRFGGLPS